MELELAAKVAIVTGGSEGIGKASAMRLCAEGAQVTICARRPEVLEQAASDIRAATGGEVLAVVADAGEADAPARVVARTVKAFGAVDILVNNAGGHRSAPFLETTDEMWQEDFEIKMYGLVRFAKAVIPHLRARGGGRIINMTTGAGKIARTFGAPTSVSRAAGLHITKIMANEYAAENILVNAICLGVLKSAQHERRFANEGQPGQTLDAYYDEVAKQRVPLGRVGEAEEVGDLVCFLASARAAYITGTAINIDGGACASV